tara:strand:+ start:1612 stop:2070 length:459 start_codon:yes stop_codon:yes gene_type:complete
MENVLVFGGSSTVLSTSYDPVSSSWKTSQQLLFEDYQQSLDRLPKSGMTVNGQLYRLDNVEHPISDAGGFALPTPTVNESKNNPSGASQWDRHDSLNVEAAKIKGLDKTTGKDFQLNPLFVEEMMGFPIGWTDLNHSETQSSHSALNGLDNK